MTVVPTCQLPVENVTNILHNPVYMPKGAVGNWLEEQFLAWQHGLKKKQTMTAFADYLGVGRDTLNKWVSGARLPTGESVDMLASKLGPEIYDLLGIPRPDPLLKIVIEKWGQLPDEVRTEIAEFVQRAEARGTVERRGKGVDKTKRK